ncbi:MAG: alpha/beta fold hydrolase [Phenylobacterium sp.]
MAAREPQIRRLRIGGRDLRVAVWKAATSGQARPLLFFNGIGANIEIMAPLAEWLSDRDLITFDMPGVGGSPEPKWPYRPWTMALRTARLLTELGYDKVDVMGVSWGGGMAQQFAFQHHRRTGRLVLAATAAGLLMVPGDLGVLSKMASPKRYIDPKFMRENFEQLYGDEISAAGGHAGRLKPPTTRGYLYQLAAMAGWTSAIFLPLVKAPTLIIMGADDKIVPAVNGKILAGLMPNARLEMVPGGHLFLVSKAGQAIPLIRAFLDEPDAAKAAA